MYWSEHNPTDSFRIPDDIVDVVYTISCRCLPVDHAHALRRAVQEALPWFANEESAGIHPVHVADSGNGWMRPDNPDDLLYLSRRTKLTLRLPRHRLDDAGTLSGIVLDINGHTLAVAGK